MSKSSNLGFVDNTHIPYIKDSIDTTKKTDSTQLPPGLVRLRQWLIDNKVTTTELGMRVGMRAETIKQFISGQAKSYPTLAQAFAFEYATSGVIKAWEFLDNPAIEYRIRTSQTNRLNEFERSIKGFVLKYKSQETVEGMVRHKARLLSRLFGVNWGEAKKRAWVDAHAKAKLQQADLTMFEDISAEEHNAQE